MSTVHQTSLKQLLRQLIFLCTPAVFMIYMLIHTTSDYFPLLNHKQHIFQTIYFALGITISCAFYSFRFRFLPSFALLLLFFAGINKVLDNFVFGEFDSFFIAIDFLLFRVLFLLGWICGWGFSRARYFPVILSTLILALGIITIATSGKAGIENMVQNFAPIPLFAFYTIFISELLRNTDENEKHSWIKPIKGLLVYTVAMVLLLFLTFKIFHSEIRSLEAKWDNKTTQNDNRNSLYDMNADSTIQMKESMSVNDNLNRSQSEDFAVFVAYIDNFFQGNDIANPLYFVSNYFTLFDDFTETFEPDSLMPYNDLFSPDPSSIPLYFTETNYDVIENGMSERYRKAVDIEVYNIQASPTEFVAPSTAYYCQPIAVNKSDFQNRYTSAYRARSYVSELNSAYFVYNNTGRDREVQQFQENRFRLLRQVRNYDDVDTAFMNYYTAYPKNAAYDTIKAIAQEIIDNVGAKTAVDKIIAIRDYFMRTDEMGTPIYQYNDVATTVPPGSRILNFLLNEHIGNCTYYAGSTYLMLRACGIPCRIATGYAIVDRSTNNKGWYWVYNNQAHAWVQAFFPGYGWLDFDTTFGDSEQQQTGMTPPGLDGTPPLDPQKAWFAGRGQVLTIDTIEKSMQFSLEKMVYYDSEYELSEAFKVKLDMSLAAIYKDSLRVPLKSINEGDNGLAISFVQSHEYDESELLPIEYILENLPSPIPIDDFRLETEKEKKEKKATEASTYKQKQKDNTILRIILLLVGISIALLIIMLATPYVIFRIYAHKAKNIKDPNKDAYYAYRAAMFLANQMGYKRKNLTPLQFAGQIVDKEFGTSFEQFTATYLKVKYAQQELANEDTQRILTFYVPFEQAVKAKMKCKKLFLQFINIYNTLEFFTNPQK